MENVSQKMIRIEPATQWSAAVEKFLDRAMLSDPLAGIDQLRAMVEANEAHLFNLIYDDYLVGAFVLRVEHKAHGAEGVIVAGGGKLPGVSLLRATIQDIEHRFKGCVSIRAHTARRGIMKELSRFGYAPREVVLAKGL